MTDDTVNRQLMSLFADEVQERAREIERTLLALEDAADPAARSELLTALLRITHSLKGAAGLVEVRSVETVCHSMEELFAEARQTGRDLPRPTLNVLLRATDAILETGRMLGRGESLPPDHLRSVINNVTETIATAESIASTTAEMPAPAHLLPAPDTHGDWSVSVPAEKLDSLLYRSAELLTLRPRGAMRSAQARALHKLSAQLRMSQMSPGPRTGYAANLAVLTSPLEPGLADWIVELESGLRNLADDLADDGRLLERAAAMLDDEVRRIRMQPFAHACQGLERLVRDMAGNQQKLADLSVEGADIEIDRSIVGGLRDALRHLVRNAMDHGIETPGERRSKGKRVTGKIIIAASLRGDRLRIRVEDDGRGLNLAWLREHAPAGDVAGPEDEDSLLRQIFLPGVSSAPVVTEVSGRGMGLDIVKSAVERLRGTVEVEHEPGYGTTFILTLPLTLTTIRGLLVLAREQIFVLDTAAVRRVTKVSADDIRFASGRAFVSLDGRTVPALDLAAWLRLRPARSRRNQSKAPVVILGRAGKETALFVDGVVGEQELLIRGLGRRLAGIRTYSGGAILPDGGVALVLNSAAISDSAVSRTEPTILDQEEHPRAKVKLLVVDDSLTVRTLEKVLLEAAGYEVVTAADGLEAWEVLQARGADAVIADVDMPGMDGFTLTEQIRASRDHAKLPIILVTAREAPHERARGIQLGADAYLLKSAFDQRELLGALGQVLQKRQ